jgi:glycosyltransferase involved in cell wall biosynthesis
MKVLHVINSLSAGGAEKLVSSLAKKQAETNEVGIFTFNNEHDIFSNFESSNLNLWETDSNKYYSLKNLIKLFQAIRNYDIIHVHLFPSLYIVALISFFSNKKFIFTEHNTHNRRREKRVFKPIEKIVYSRFGCIICISNSVKIELEKWIGKNKDMIIIPNFIDINEIDKAKPIKREFLGFNKRDIILVMVGSFSPQKDQSTILKSLKVLPGEYKLVLIGDGTLRNKIEQFVKENNLDNRVKLLGVRNDVYSVIKVCNYGIQSSNWEGFGIAALEYMACGLVTLGSNVKGLNEIIPIKNNLFTVNDYKKLAFRLLQIENSKMIQNQILKSQFDLIKKYDICYSISQHSKAYKAVLD